MDFYKLLGHITAFKSAEAEVEITKARSSADRLKDIVSRLNGNPTKTGGGSIASNNMILYGFGAVVLMMVVMIGR